jgi:DNA polymerase-2
VTSFGRKFLLSARDFFEARGYRTLYGDTDSVFVESGLGAAADYATLEALGSRLADELNAELALAIRAEYDLPSYLRIRCEKIYRRFFIPRLRLGAQDEGEAVARGRAKGYAGLRIEADGSSRIEVKGMEAARSDWTPLARRFQVELLGLIFATTTAAEVRDYCAGLAAALRAGELDGELVYRKALRRHAEDYASASPQVRAARLLGWEGKRGSVSFVMTKAGPEPLSRRTASPLDYEHYVGHQLLPIARAIVDALAARARSLGGGAEDWDVERWFADRPQMELGF